ncbi:hypothetical protein BGHDH14_bgh02705 [Blumeria hordei DH14]|uniref:DUF3824 domain-containing protein n=1 Tax=Blumeria graminis f. sp. hordei (strain DH14) TaxID=546991 RepID=N1J9M5_BLUG1|nr:hypothetical protein BGHDH14_bgh02705 [Blumeria hordei DH14]
MSTPENRRRSHDHSDRKDKYNGSYAEGRDSYNSHPYSVSEASHQPRNHQITRRSLREGSDLSSVEEIRREFSPPGIDSYPRDKWYNPYTHTRLDKHEAHQGSSRSFRDSNSSYSDVESRPDRQSSLSLERKKGRHYSLSRNEMIMAAVGGAALAVGGKELWDRRNSDKRTAPTNNIRKAVIGAAGALAGYEGADIFSKRSLETNQNNSDLVQQNNSDSRQNNYHYSEGDRSNRSRKTKPINRRDSRNMDARSLNILPPESVAYLQQAARAALLAGATEAFRVRNEPGGWSGEKGKRILTAAIGASAVDAAGERKHHILEAVVAGLAGNQLINGSRHKDESRSSRSRSRIRSRSQGPGKDTKNNLAALASAGIATLAGNRLVERSRSRSRQGKHRRSSQRSSRRRHESFSSYDSRSSSLGRENDRKNKDYGMSVTDLARKGLAVLGFGDKTDHDRDQENDYSSKGR